MSAPSVWVVTGAAGFIGRAVLTRLRERDARVRALVQSEAQRSSLPTWGQLEVRVADLSRPDEVRDALADLTGVRVIHLAGGRLASGSASDDAHDALNVAPTQTLVDCAIGLSPEAFVLASTGEVYGGVPVPFHEDQVVHPTSSYARTKLRAERRVLEAHAKRGLPSTVARMSVAYGPGQTGTMLIPSLMRALADGLPLRMTRGEQTRDFVFVDDVAEALVRLAETPGARGQIVNVARGEAFAVREATAMLAQALGRPVALELGAIPYREGEVMEYLLDVGKLERLTGYRPPTSLGEGLARVARGA